MRKLRHPIALFVVAVLVVIGIGVGVNASGWSGPESGVLQEYGSPGYRFEASFPGSVTCGVLGVPGPLRVHECQSSEQGSEPGVVSFAVAVTKVRGLSSTNSASIWTVNLPGAKPIRFGRIHGEKWPAHCSAAKKANTEQRCVAYMAITDGITDWLVTAYGSVTSATTRPLTQFLDSFQPIG
jgi:hypothetical protein